MTLSATSRTIVPQIAPAVAPIAPAQPVCFLVEQEAGVRRLVSSVLEPLCIAVAQFGTLSEMLKAAEKIHPDIIFLDVTVGGSGGIDLIRTLGEARIECPVQLMSGLNAMLIEEVRRTGERSGLKMLPVLHKPFRHGAVRQVVQDLGLRRDALASANITLADVIGEKWLELWYQPKIDLAKNIMVGAECFVRARHPELGVLAPDAFLSGAGEDELLDLTRRVLGRALQDWKTFAELGVPMEFSVNVPLIALSKMSIFGLLWEERPEAANFPGLILELSEAEIIPNMHLAFKAVRELRTYGISLAVDDFGPGYSELSRLKELPFSEVKIDRGCISNCDVDQMNAGLCETIVEFARRFGIKAVAEGIETVGELKTLRKVGCHMGQGYLFARPMPKNEFAAVVRQRKRPRPA
jgi:EAL domain-containing protein (putative c-di-GMP-specific phosphodiesterase class I)